MDGRGRTWTPADHRTKYWAPAGRLWLVVTLFVSVNVLDPALVQPGQRHTEGEPDVHMSEPTPDRVVE